MRIAVTHPWCWPYVQRGGERLFDDLVRHLSGAGHDVLAVSAGPVASSTTTTDGVERVVHRTSRGRIGARLRIDQSVTYLPAAACTVRRWKPDVVHGMYHLDGVLALLARTHPVVVHVQGMPRSTALLGQPVQRFLLKRSLRTADAVVAVSAAAARALETEFGHPARSLHNGVATEPFVAAGRAAAPDATPTILFPSAPDDPRKRLDLLVAAANLVASNRPGLRIRIPAAASPATIGRIEAASKVPLDWVGSTDPGAMPAEYARAWITCAPAVREAFGLVYVESMAAGRPAVGVRDGGVAEVVDEDRWLAAPDDEHALAEAIENAFVDSQRPETADRCRARAAQFDWSERGPAFEALYRELLGR